MEQAKEIISLEVRVQGDVHHLGTMNSMFGYCREGDRELVRGHQRWSKLGTGTSSKLVRVKTLYLEANTSMHYH